MVKNRLKRRILKENVNCNVFMGTMPQLHSMKNFQPETRYIDFNFVKCFEEFVYQHGNDTITHSQNRKIILVSFLTFFLKLGPASSYLCSNPRVQANIEAILFVLVSCPF